MEEKLPTMMNAIDPDNKNNTESQKLTESNPEEKKESISSNPSEEKPSQNIKTEMCQLIYYDFSLK